MSKLDDILIDVFESPWHTEGNQRVSDTTYTTGIDGKQQIKTLVLALISDNYHEGGNTETLIEKINSL
jgi:hypothetical protein